MPNGRSLADKGTKERAVELEKGRKKTMAPRKGTGAEGGEPKSRGRIDAKAKAVEKRDWLQGQLEAAMEKLSAHSFEKKYLPFEPGGPATWKYPPRI